MTKKWTENDARRRAELIMKDINGKLVMEEQAELTDLTTLLRLASNASFVKMRQKVVERLREK